MLSYSFNQVINILDTAEIAAKKETPGRTDLYVGRWMKSKPRDKAQYIGVSNETPYGVMQFVHAAKLDGLPKIMSI
uniref:Uncharacterized protein n=1 Tax=Aegilops tauschii subsp. strangulata TaxID=200361 RepID=A0A453T044_AEGTS